MDYITEYTIRAGYDEGVDPEKTGKMIYEYLTERFVPVELNCKKGDLPYEILHCSGHWYDHEEHLKSVARKFPGCTLTIHGKGEEVDDVWEIEFKGNSMRYRAVTILWRESANFEGKFEPAYYTLYIDFPRTRRVSELCPDIIDWMKANSPEWTQVFDLNVQRAVKVFESNGAAEWYGYAQMHDLSAAFPDCTFELRCVPVRKGSEYVYRISNDKEYYEKTELVWMDWSDWS